MSILRELSRLFAELNARRVRGLVIGVSGVNFYARTGHTIFATEDQGLLPRLRREANLATRHLRRSSRSKSSADTLSPFSTERQPRSIAAWSCLRSSSDRSSPSSSTTLSKTSPSGRSVG